MQVIVCGRIGDDTDNDDDCLSVFFLFFYNNYALLILIKIKNKTRILFDIHCYII